MKSRTSTAAVKMILMLGMGLVSGSVAHAGGLRCSFGEVMIENLTIGSSNSLERIAALPLTLTNSGDRSVTVDIQPTIPAGSELRYGAQPIPDLSWVALTRSSVALDAQESVQVDITLHIPNDGKYVGGKYQVNVWSHTQAQPGELVAIGLTSRVIFTVSKQSDTESVGTPGASVALVPAEVTLRGVGLGQTFSLQTDLDRSLVLKNPSARPVTVELNALHRRTLEQVCSLVSETFSRSRRSSSPRNASCSNRARRHESREPSASHGGRRSLSAR
ncbi:MAG: hypothetical protein R3E12_18675 [Candidatus Eisenbacteria bacterium]